MWKAIKDYEGLYEINDFGEVKSLERKVKKQDGYRTVKEKIICQKPNECGYPIVQLCKDGKKSYFAVHRLVAITFLDNPNNLPQVNHKDENKLNNCVSNLEWCTAKYNTNYGSRIERVSTKRKLPIQQFDLQGNLIKEWDSAKDIQDNLGYPTSNICSACKGRQKTAYNFVWRYKL